MKLIILTLCLTLMTPLMVQAQSTTEVVTLESVLTPSNEVPPLPATVQGSGTATVVINLKRDPNGDAASAFVDFIVNADFGSAETIRAMHIHRGDSSISGPVVLDSSFGDETDVAAGSTSFARRVEFVTSADLEVIEEVIADPSEFYLNVHTASAPGGIMRGQLVNADQTARLDEIHELLRRVALRVGVSVEN
jgi:hypothetical protein